MFDVVPKEFVCTVVFVHATTLGISDVLFNLFFVGMVTEPEFQGGCAIGLLDGVKLKDVVTPFVGHLVVPIRVGFVVDLVEEVECSLNLLCTEGGILEVSMNTEVIPLTTELVGEHIDRKDIIIVSGVPYQREVVQDSSDVGKKVSHVNKVLSKWKCSRRSSNRV